MTTHSFPRTWSQSHVAIDLERQPVTSVRVGLFLPEVATRVLAGKTPSQALTLMPSIYAVCAHAHGNAAAEALSAAEGRVVPDELRARRDALAGIEAVREGIVRAGLDWSHLVGDAAAAEAIRPALSLVARLRTALFGGEQPFFSDVPFAPDVAVAYAVVEDAEAALGAAVFGEPIDVWRQRRVVSDVAGWAAQRATGAARAIDFVLRSGWTGEGAGERIGLDKAGLVRIAHRLADGESVPSVMAGLRPGVPETGLGDGLGAQSVQAEAAPGGGLLRRMLTLLGALADLPALIRRALYTLRPSGHDRMVCSARPGCGFAAVGSPRGLLIHSVELRDGLIARYDVLQPTRMNFDAEGAAARDLRSLLASIRGNDTSLAQMARLVVASLSPCVPSTVRVG